MADLPGTVAPLGPLARAVMGLLGVQVLLAWALLAGVVIFLERLWFGLAGHAQPQGSLAEHLAQLEALRVLQGLGWIATATLFLLWVHRAYRNLGALGVAGLGDSPRWAVGAFPVPALNLIHPLHVMRDLWNASRPGAGAEEPRAGGISPWLGCWWGLLLAAAVLDPSVLRPLEPMAVRLDLGGGMYRLVLGALVEMAAGVLGIVVVARITGFQGQRLAGHAGRAGVRP
jgi:hypothetical protein